MTDDVKALIAEARERAITVGPNRGIVAADGVAGTPFGDVLRAESALVQRLADALEAASARPVPPTDAKALIAEARQIVERVAESVGSGRGAAAQAIREGRSADERLALLVKMADALEAVSARPLVADQEAVAEAMRVQASRGMYSMPSDKYPYQQWAMGVTDALFASGVIQSKGDAQAEALEEAAGMADSAGHHTGGQAAIECFELAEKYRARAAAYRTPASPDKDV